MLHDGLYEQIINKGLDTELSGTDKLSQTAPIDSAEASKIYYSWWGTYFYFAFLCFFLYL